ncbi:MAG: glycosyltransferase family 39 protein [Bacteroidales bacterium]|nr:glycosyltransferase family 39 protein [Bacteroidales bacterium]
MSIKIVVQLLAVNPVYELHRDEFLYLDQAKHIAFGFISVPPLSSLISALIFSLGGGVFWVRFFPALFGAFTILFAWLTIDKLGGKFFSKILVSCALIFSVYIRLNILYQPNAFDILSWTAAFYFLVRYIRDADNRWLLFLMLTFVLGFYNKYTIIFLFAGILLGILLTRHRKILTQKYFYISLAIGLILVLPNLYWQVSNNFPVLYHMQALKSTQLDYTSTSGFLTEQLMFMSGSLLVVIAALVGLFVYKEFKEYRLIGLVYLIVILIFILLKAKGYYALGLYPVLLVFGGVFFESILIGFRKKLVFGFLILANLISFLYIYDSMLPVKTPEAIIANNEKFERLGLLKWNDGKNHHIPQDFADMLGWKEMAEKALIAYKLIPTDEKEQTLVFCDNYGQAGALNYYNRYKMPEAYSANTDYIFWLPRINKIKNVLLVGKKPSDEITAMFKNIELVGVVKNGFAIEKNTGIYLLSGANEDFTDTFYQIMDKRISDFDIF